MYKVQMFLKDKEIPTQQLWETLDEAEGMECLYRVYFEAQGTRNFTTKIIEIESNAPSKAL
ncbi:MAG: hypothetical protein RSA78_02245 [Oscillospiraceae bacterium]